MSKHIDNVMYPQLHVRSGSSRRSVVVVRGLPVVFEKNWRSGVISSQIYSEDIHVSRQPEGVDHLS